MKDKFSPNYIESLEENEVFVFGSNLDGYPHRSCSKDCQRAFWSSMGASFSQSSDIR